MPARPPRADLERFLLGTLPLADAARVAEWVAVAPEATEALRGLTAADTFTAALRAAARPGLAQMATASGPAPTVNQGQAAPAAVPARPFPPAAVGGFAIVRELGRGGMGAVFEATEAALGRRVALKVMLPAVAAHPQARARFLREARAAARVEHEAVVPIYQVGEADGVAYIAMPLLAGAPLSGRLTGGRPLPIADILLFGRQVAEGLAAAHEKGLIHRDIKPANIWIDGPPAAPVQRARILDFGLARAADDPVLTGAGDVLGTPAYMSPEQARGRSVDFRTDLHSLGVVLYHAATGRRPFDGRTAYEVLAALATHTPSPAAQLNPTVPPALSALIARLMSKDPAGRPPSARAVADELARIAAPPLPRQNPSALPTRPTQPPVPPSPVSGPAAVAPLTLDDLPDPAPAAAVTSPPTRPPFVRRNRPVLLAVGAVVFAGLAVGGVLATRDGKSRSSEEAKGEGGPKQEPPNKKDPAPVKPPFVPPETVTLPAGDRGTPEDPARKLGVWLHAQGWEQNISVWDPQGPTRTLSPHHLLPGGLWTTREARLFLTDKRPMTDADLKQFEHPALVIGMLSVTGQPFTDDWLDKMTRLPFAQKLSGIGLTDTAVTDDGLLYLTRCKNLGSLSLSGAGFTSEGVERLVQLLPARVGVRRPKFTAPK